MRSTGAWYARRVLLALLIATAPQIPLFSDPRLSEALGGFHQRAGAWVEYAILPRRGPQARLKASVLAPLASRGRYWLEIVSEQQGGLPVAVKMLLHGPPGTMENVERIYLYVAGQAPVELPLDDARADAGSPPGGPLPRVRRKGTEQLVLAAGKFRCDVLQLEGSRLYRSAQVPLWGMVRAITPEERVELVGFGESGAVTVFPEPFGEGAQGKGSESAK